MKYVKTLLYVGEDAEFLSLVLNFFKVQDPEVKVLSKPYSSGVLVNTFADNPYHVLLVDFTCLESTTEILEEVSYLKRVESAAGVLFSVLYKDEGHRALYPHIFSLGFSLSFIKGCEADVFLRDISYISFTSSIAYPSFAKAKNLFTKLEIGLCSTITEMNEESFFIDTDFETNSGEIATCLPMFEELECKSFIAKQRLSAAKIYPMINSYELEYPYASPWEDETSANISKSTVETWIGLNSENSTLKPIEILVFTNELNIIRELYSINSAASLCINYFNHATEALLEIIALKKPAIIFFEYSSEGDSNIHELSLLVSSLKSIPEYDPFLVVTNNQSSSIGLQKALMYKFVLSTKDPLSLQVFKALTDTFLKKRGEEKVGSNLYRFELGDTRRAVDINIPIVVSSITEHEITFYSKSSLPSFAVLHFLGPLEFYATIVPENDKLKAKEGYYHYKSVIHGLSENELMMLRQFVNKVIYDPEMSFEKCVIETTMMVTEDESAEKPVLLLDTHELDSPSQKDATSGLKEINGALKVKSK